MAIGIGIDEVVKVSVCTYRGPMNIGDDVYEFLDRDLRDITDNGKVRIEGVDEPVDAKDIDIDYWYRDNWKETMAKTLYNCIDTVRGKPLSEYFKKYGIKIVGVEFWTPNEYNFKTDHLDLMMEFDKYERREDYPELIPFVQDYLDNVRKRSCDGYMSYEPSRIEEVEKDDYSFIRAICKKEGIYDDIHDALIDAVYDVIDNEFEMMDYCFRYKGNEYKIDVQDRCLYSINKEDD